MMKRLEAAFRPESKYRAFFLSIITFGLAYGLYKGVIDNYLAEIVGMSGFVKGVSEFFRELPGLLLIVMLAVLSIPKQDGAGKRSDCRTPRSRSARWPDI